LKQTDGSVVGCTEGSVKKKEERRQGRRRESDRGRRVSRKGGEVEPFCIVVAPFRDPVEKASKEKRIRKGEDNRS